MLWHYLVGLKRHCKRLVGLNAAKLRTVPSIPDLFSDRT